jgi:hypothetical protein
MMAWNAHPSLQSLAKRLADWHEGRGAARMLIAALGAYVLTSMIHLPAPYTSVITTVVVARPHSDGVLRASLERVLATILGAGLACVASFGRLVHIPEPLLLVATLAPLALVVAHNSAYRTALIAAMIVLSAPVVVGSPLHVAGIRMLGVGLGSLVGALVSVTVVPSHRDVVVRKAVAKLLKDLPVLLANAVGSAAEQGAGSRSPPSNDYKLEFRVRLALREIWALVRDRPDGPPVKGKAAALYGAIAHTHADIAFLKRELQAHSPSQEAMSSLANVVRAFEQAADRVVGNTSAPSSNGASCEFVQICEQAAERLGTTNPSTDGAALMLRRLAQDFSSVARLMGASGMHADASVRRRSR